MSKNWNYVSSSSAVLPQKLDPEVMKFLSLPQNSKIVYWLDDSHMLIQHAHVATTSAGHRDEYYDYAFMITPAFKALEHWIIQIAPAIGVEQKLIDDAREKGKFNAFLGDEPIQKLADAVLKKLDIESKKKKALRASLTSLSSYLSTLRHTPAHAGHIIERPSKAETYFNEIVGAINRITALLIEAKVIDFEDPQTGNPRTDTVWVQPQKN